MSTTSSTLKSESASVSSTSALIPEPKSETFTPQYTTNLPERQEVMADEHYTRAAALVHAALNAAQQPDVRMGARQDDGIYIVLAYRTGDMCAVWRQGHSGMRWGKPDAVIAILADWMRADAAAESTLPPLLDVWADLSPQAQAALATLYFARPDWKPLDDLDMAARRQLLLTDGVVLAFVNVRREYKISALGVEVVEAALTAGIAAPGTEPCQAPAAAPPVPITDPRRLLPARCPQPVTGPVFVALSAEEEHLLIFAYTYLCNHEQLEDGRWFPVAQHSRAAADVLVQAGYFTRHPSARRKMWYGVTENGQARARAALDAANGGGSPAWSFKPHTPLEAYRLENLNRLVRDLAQQGYVPLLETGRGPQYGEVAFFNVFTRRIELWRSRFAVAHWRRYDGGYHQPTSVDDPAVAVQPVAALDF